MEKRKIGCLKSLKDSTFKLNIGTMDKNNPYAFYIEGKTFLIPQENENIKESYEESVVEFKKSVLRYTTRSKYVKSYPKPIITTDVATDQLKYGKNSKMRLYCFFVQKNEPPIPINELGDAFYDDFSSVTNNFKKSLQENGFIVQKEKI